MSIDTLQAEAAFASSEDATVGLEEEFAILDPDTLDLVPGYEALRDAGQADDVLGPGICGELISSEIEIVSGRGETFAEATQAQRERRRRLFALAERQGYALGATGTHPWADYREQPNIDTEHYRRVVEGLQWVARRNNTFSLHVHVGVRDADRAVRVCDRLRAVLPTLLAVSAGSPFMDGRDSGLHSARTQMFTKTFPRCGIPDAYGSWAEYARYIELLKATGSIVEYTQVWWSVRPHFSFGTVEVRICDAQATAPESEALAGLITACVLQAARDIDEGVAWTDHPRRLLEENLWRAIRFGMDGKLIDWEAEREVPAPAAVEALLAWTAPVRADHGLGEPALDGPNAAQRQRALLADGHSLHEVYAATVADTQSTYSMRKATTR